MIFRLTTQTTPGSKDCGPNSHCLCNTGKFIAYSMLYECYREMVSAFKRTGLNFELTHADF